MGTGEGAGGGGSVQECMDCAREGWGVEKEEQAKRSSVCVVASFVLFRRRHCYVSVVGVARMFWVVGGEVGDRKGVGEGGRRKRRRRREEGAHREHSSYVYLFFFRRTCCVRACADVYVFFSLWFLSRETAARFPSWVGIRQGVFISRSRVDGLRW